MIIVYMLVSFVSPPSPAKKHSLAFRKGSKCKQKLCGEEGGGSFWESSSKEADFAGRHVLYPFARSAAWNADAMSGAQVTVLAS